MKTAEMTIETARKLYGSADAATKKWLESEFSAEDLVENLYDKCKTWGGVCMQGGFDPVGILPYPKPENGLQRFANACIKWAIISHVLRGGKKHDWTKNTQKWRPWYDMSSGSGLRSYVFDYDYTYASVGSRHSFASKEDAKHADEYFQDVAHDLFMEID